MADLGFSESALTTLLISDLVSPNPVHSWSDRCVGPVSHLFEKPSEIVHQLPYERAAPISGLKAIEILVSAFP